MATYASPPSDHAGHLRVYLVEDSPIMLRLLRDLLTAEPGIEIAGCSASAGIAVEGIAASNPDVAIVDIALEQGSGFDVLKALLAIGRPRPVVMVLTNFATQHYRREAERLRADYFFDKSRDILRLLSTVSGIAKRKLWSNGSER